MWAATVWTISGIWGRSGRLTFQHWGWWGVLGPLPRRDQEHEGSVSWQRVPEAAVEAQLLVTFCLQARVQVMERGMGEHDGRAVNRLDMVAQVAEWRT